MIQLGFGQKSWPDAIKINERKTMKNADNNGIKLGAQRIAERHATYNQAKADIANLLGWFECELQKDNDKSWGQIGNLQKVRSDLTQTLAFLSNIDPESIKESLEDARTLDNAK